MAAPGTRSPSSHFEVIIMRTGQLSLQMPSSSSRYPSIITPFILFSYQAFPCLPNRRSILRSTRARRACSPPRPPRPPLPRPPSAPAPARCCCSLLCSSRPVRLAARCSLAARCCSSFSSRPPRSASSSLARLALSRSLSAALSLSLSPLAFLSPRAARRPRAAVALPRAVALAPAPLSFCRLARARAPAAPARAPARPRARARAPRPRARARPRAPAAPAAAPPLAFLEPCSINSVIKNFTNPKSFGVTVIHLW